MASHILKQNEVVRSRAADEVGTSPADFRLVPAIDSQSLPAMTSRDLRKCFLIEDLFRPAHLQVVCSEYDRLIVGSAVPCFETIALNGGSGLRAEYFTERRELGVINLGGCGVIEVEGTGYELGDRDGLYIGRGNPRILFRSQDPERPAAFYLVSYPAHATHPVRLMRKQEAEHVQLGDPATSNRRELYKYIHPAGVQSCQLVMGLTELAAGSVWNTMPAHIHERRSEVYLYFDLPENALVVHCLGRPQETRHVVIRNRQAVLSPSWSIHAGAGTSNYSFIWAMGGENQDFSDMNPIPMGDLA